MQAAVEHCFSWVRGSHINQQGGLENTYVGLNRKTIPVHPEERLPCSKGHYSLRLLACFANALTTPEYSNFLHSQIITQWELPEDSYSGLFSVLTSPKLLCCIHWWL